MYRQQVPILEDVRETALRPLKPSGRPFWLLAAVLTLMAVWGLVAFGVQLVSGLGAAGYSDQGFWGIYEANLVAFIAVSYGGALVSAILRLTDAGWRAPITRMAEATAVFSLLVGMSFALVHLGRPDQVWRLLVSPNLSSPIVWDFIVVMTYLLATVIFLYLPLVPDLAVVRDRLEVKAGLRWRFYSLLALGWQGLPEQRRMLARGVTAVAIIIIPLAVAVHSVLSWAFSLSGRPGWDSTIFAPYFVAAALYAGVAMVILVVAGFRKGYHLEPYVEPKHFRYLAYIMITLDLVYLYFTFSEMLTEGYVMNEQSVPVLTSLLLGQYAPFFWLFTLGGGLVPLLLVAIPRTRTVRGIVVASALVVAAMWLKRLLIVVPVAAEPLIAGAWGTFRITWIPIAITVAAAAAIPLLLMLFFKVCPILSIDEIEEVAAEGASHEAASWHKASARLREGGIAQ